MKSKFLDKVRKKSADILPNSEGPRTHNTDRHRADRIGLAYQMQAAEQARAALQGRLEESKTFSEEWMRMYVRRGA